MLLLYYYISVLSFFYFIYLNIFSWETPYLLNNSWYKTDFLYMIYLFYSKIIPF